MQTILWGETSEHHILQFPDENTELLPGLKWGRVEDFPSPAYWAFQARIRQLAHRKIEYQLGETFKEEVAACLLGGHGISAEIGLAAFKHLKNRGAFSGSSPDEALLFSWLTEPLLIGKRSVYYRFARQKAHYLSIILPELDEVTPNHQTGKCLRAWLVTFPGIGPKTASWIARNWLGATDVAILDIHVLRAGQIIGLFEQGKKIETHYFELEDRFLQFASGLGVDADELDAVIWYEMMASPLTVRHILTSLQNNYLDPTTARPTPRKRLCKSNSLAQGSPVIPKQQKLRSSASATSPK